MHAHHQNQGAGRGHGLTGSIATTLRLPDFLGIGTQKGGTTSLQLWLAQHPQVFLPTCKEVHYFSLHAQQPVSWYGELYRQALPQQRCGDITPYYLFHPEAPERIRQVLPAVQLVVLLRDPVERTLSHYFHARRLGFEALPLQKALQMEEERLSGAEACLAEPGAQHYSHQKHSYLARSRYELQLARYERYFKSEQLLLIRSEDLFEAPERCWLQLCRFLGIAAEATAVPLQRANAGGGEKVHVPPQLRAWLREQLQPTYATLASRWDISWPTPADPAPAAAAAP